MIEIVSGLVQGVGASRQGVVAIVFAFLAAAIGYYGKGSELGLIGFVIFGLLAIVMLIWGFVSFVSGWIKEEKGDKTNRR